MSMLVGVPVLAVVLLVVQAMAHPLLDRVGISQWGAPSLTLPLILSLAVGDISLVRGAVLAFVVGVLTDAYNGNPMGWWTTASVATFLLTRLAGLRLFLSGPVFQVGLTFAAFLLANLFVGGLYAVLGGRAWLAIGPAAALLTSQAAVTALFAPSVFAIVGRIRALSRTRAEEV